MHSSPLPTNRLHELSQALDVCAPVLQGTLVYIDYPIHGNIGDLLIWHGSLEFLKRHNKTVLGYYSHHNIGAGAIRHMQTADTICLHGGGNLGDIWPVQEQLREDIIQNHHHKRIVILPQTVHFDSSAALERACTIFKQHPDLHIFLRDERSYQILHDMGVRNLALCPDMAHALFGKIAVQDLPDRPTLYLLRRDKEGKCMAPDLVPPRSRLFDWEDLLTGWTQQIYLQCARLHRVDQRWGNILPAYQFWRIFSWVMITRAVSIFNAHGDVVTNRMHAVILSALMGKHVTACDNSYGKLSGYIACWLDKLSTVRFHAS